MNGDSGAELDQPSDRRYRREHRAGAGRTLERPLRPGDEVAALQAVSGG